MLAGGLDDKLRPEEAVLWSVYRALDDADLAHGLAGAPKVRSVLCHTNESSLCTHLCISILLVFYGHEL